MTKRIASKDKINRRLGCNLWGRAKSAYNRRENRPGMHGARRRKLSDYGTQLVAKQRLRGYYGNIGERQFRNYYRQADQQKGDTAANLIQLLERRLDAVVYRAKFVPTVFAARQFVSHGHVTVNGRRVMVASYLLSVGDVVSVREKSRDLAIVIESQALAEREVPDYISVDTDTMSATFSGIPTLEDIPYPVRMEPSLVVEYYSR